MSDRKNTGDRSAGRQDPGRKASSGVGFAVLLIVAGLAAPAAAAPASPAAPGAAAAPAAPSGAPAVLSFDQPLSEKTLPPTNAAPDEVKCTSFADLVIREQFDGPTSQPPRLLAANAPCARTLPAGARAVELEDMAFEGRKGPFLLFYYMDPNGAADFAVVEAAGGKVVFKDSLFGDMEAKRATLENGALRLGFLRGVNTHCSLYEDGGRCWAATIAEGLLPKDMEKQAPDGKICAAAYRKANAPKDNPSIITYPVEVLIAADGTVKPLSRGKVGCESLP